MAELAAHVAVDVRRLQRVGRDRQPLDDLVRPPQDALPVLESPRLPLVRVEHDVALRHGLAAHPAPLDVGREARPAAAGEPRRFELVEHPRGTALARRLERPVARVVVGPEVDREVGVAGREVRRGRAGVPFRVPQRGRHVTAAQACGEGRLGAGGLELGHLRVTPAQLAGEALADAHPGVGIGEQVVERADAVHVGLGHAGAAVNDGGRPLAEAAFVLEYVEDLFATGVLGQHCEATEDSGRG